MSHLREHGKETNLPLICILKLQKNIYLHKLNLGHVQTLVLVAFSKHGLMVSVDGRALCASFEDSSLNSAWWHFLVDSAANGHLNSTVKWIKKHSLQEGLFYFFGLCWACNP